MIYDIHDMWYWYCDRLWYDCQSQYTECEYIRNLCVPTLTNIIVPGWNVPSKRYWPSIIDTIIIPIYSGY